MSTDVDQLLAKAAQRKARAAEVGASLSESSTPCDPRTGFLAPQIEKKIQVTKCTIVTTLMG